MVNDIGWWWRWLGGVYDLWFVCCLLLRMVIWSFGGCSWVGLIDFVTWVLVVLFRVGLCFVMINGFGCCGCCGVVCSVFTSLVVVSELLGLGVGFRLGLGVWVSGVFWCLVVIVAADCTLDFG